MFPPLTLLKPLLLFNTATFFLSVLLHTTFIQISPILQLHHVWEINIPPNIISLLVSCVVFYMNFQIQYSKLKKVFY